MSTYELNAIMKDMLAQADEMEAYRQETGLTSADTSEEPYWWDRWSTAWQTAGFEQKDTYDNMVATEVQKYERQINGYEDLGGLPPTVGGGEYYPDMWDIAERYKDREQEILDERAAGNPKYQNVKTYTEIKQDLGKEYKRLLALDEVQTQNSSFAGSVGWLGGAITGFLRSPVNAAIAIGSGGTGSVVGVPLRIAIRNAAEMIAIDQALNTVQVVRDTPTYEENFRYATGRDLTGDEKVQNLAVQGGFILGFDILGSAGARIIGNIGSKYPAIPDTVIPGSEIPKSRFETGAEDDIQPTNYASGNAITPEFAAKVQSAQDPIIADAAQEFVDVAKITPENMDQSAHFSNYTTIGDQFNKGDNIDLPFRVENESPYNVKQELFQENRPDILPPDTNISRGAEQYRPTGEVNATEATASFNPWKEADDLGYRIQQEHLNPVVREVPVDELYKMQLNEIDKYLDSLPPSFELPNADDVRGPTIKAADLKLKFKELRDDLDAAEKISVCWRGGGPGGRGAK